MYLTLRSHILFQEYGGRYFKKVKRIFILSQEYGGRYFAKVKRIDILIKKYGGQYFEKVLFINLFYFVVSIGITACSIIMDIALVIKTAE